MTKADHLRISDLIKKTVDRAASLTPEEREVFDALWMVYAELVAKERIVNECIQICSRMNKVLR